VVGDDEEIEMADLVDGAHEVPLLFPGEIAKVVEADFAPGRYEADGVVVFDGVGRIDTLRIVIRDGAGCVFLSTAGMGLSIILPSALMIVAGRPGTGSLSPVCRMTG